MVKRKHIETQNSTFKTQTKNMSRSLWHEQRTELTQQEDEQKVTKRRKTKTIDEMETPEPKGCLKSCENPGVSTLYYLQVTHHLYPELGSVCRHCLSIT